MLPNFFIVGAPKAGTTSLYHYLESHPDIYMSPVKEPNYFSHEDIVKQDLFYNEKGIASLAEYEALFNGATTEKAIGEASVSYLFYDSVPGKIKKRVPDARIIIMLRNPVDRAFSHFSMDKRLGYVNESFESIFEHTGKSKLSHLYYQQYIELGNYYKQVKRYLDIFPKEQIKIFLLRDMKTDTPQLVKQLYKFLDVDENFVADVSEKFNSNAAPRTKLMSRLYQNQKLRSNIRRVLPANTVETVKKFLFTPKKESLPDELVVKLKAYYKSDIEQLENLLQKDLKVWL